MSAGDGHGQRLSAVDASLLRLEDRAALMHIGFSAIFSLPAGVKRPTVGALRARAASRLHLLPRCRQRLAQAPLGLGEPRWVDDARFDLDEHVMALSTPDDAVTMQRFAALRDLMLSEPLPRDRPLWHLLMIPRLQDGRVGLVGRVHHAMADGTTALHLAMLLADRDGGSDDVRSLCAWSPQPPPSSARWALDPLADGARLLGETARGVTDVIRRPRHSVGEALGAGRRLAQALREDTLPRAPRSPVNVPVGPSRTLVGYRTDARALRAAADGGTLNDAGLAVVAGALRALTVQRDEPAQWLKAMVPVSLRRAAHTELGNRLSSAAVWLPLHLASPAARLASVREQTAAIKHSRRHHATATLMGAIAWLPGPPREAAFRAAASPRAYNLLASYIPEARAALEMLGARLEEIYPAVPIGHRHALAIGMLSYDGQLHFGLHADPDALADVDELPALLGDEVAALQCADGAPAVVSSLEAHRAARIGLASNGRQQRSDGADAEVLTEARSSSAPHERASRSQRQDSDEHA